MFYCEYCEIFINSFLTEHPPVAASAVLKNSYIPRKISGLLQKWDLGFGTLHLRPYTRDPEPIRGTQGSGPLRGTPDLGPRPGTLLYRNQSVDLLY